jgi:hypothetical protein
MSDIASHMDNISIMGETKTRAFLLKMVGNLLSSNFSMK